MSVAEVVTIVVTVGIFLYLVALQTITLTLIVIGGWTVRDYLRRRPMRDFRDVARSSLSMAVTLMVPAYNEAATIRSSVSALFSNEYATFEVVVVNDGSTDDTLAALIDHFDLVPFQRAPRAGLVTQPVLATYVSRTQPRLFVVDKENGGKADSLNAALNYARYPLVCALDADTLLDPQALARIVWEFEAHPETIAVGGIVRVANGSVFDGTRITRVRTPTGLLPNLQIMEYLRAFLGARIGWSKLNMLIIISGAFGVFRREVLVDVGGYNTQTVGEDAELVLRMHRRARDSNRPYRITFFPDPICWTEVPTSLRVLARQRDRWQRGLGQMLWLHRDMFFRPRYRGGRIGRNALFLDVRVVRSRCGGLRLPVRCLRVGVRAVERTGGAVVFRVRGAGRYRALLLCRNNRAARLSPLSAVARYGLAVQCGGVGESRLPPIPRRGATESNDSGRASWHSVGRDDARRVQPRSWCPGRTRRRGYRGFTAVTRAHRPLPEGYLNPSCRGDLRPINLVWRIVDVLSACSSLRWCW